MKEFETMIGQHRGNWGEASVLRLQKDYWSRNSNQKAENPKFSS
jgi:hypothetical protein